MATSRTSQVPTLENPQTLVSWKSIAGYFHCDERTAKRWERERGLPVHRAPGGKRSSVFAYSAELDSWLRAGEHDLDLHRDTSLRGATTESPRLGAIGSGPGQNSLPVRASSIESRLSRRWPVGLAASAMILFLLVAALLVHGYQHAATLRSPHVGATSDPQRHIPAPGAEDLYLEGRYFWNLRTADSLSKAIDAYTQAIVKDPSYAEAYAGLAESYDLLPQFAHGDLAEAFVRAKSAADRAIELNPNVAAAHRAKAFALFFWDWDISDSDAEFRRALALDPNSAETHQWYASTLLNRLDGAECLRQIDSALRLNPASASIATDAALMHEEFGDDSIASIKRLQDLERTQPTLLTPSYFLKQIYFAKGDYPAYLGELRRIASITGNPDDDALANNAARGWARSGRLGMAQEIIGVQKKAFQNGSEPGFWLGQTYLLLGRPKDALPYFKASLDKHFILLITMQDCDWAEKLSTDPDYAAFFSQIRERMHRGQILHPQAIPTTFRLPL